VVNARGYTPERGDLVFLNFTPQAGREQAGRRPALVLSPASYNGKVGLMLACPVTNQAKGYPFEVALPEDCAVTGVVLSDHVKNLDWRVRDVSYAGVAGDDVVEAVLERLRLLL
jgi:mRNA interferase MazF